MPAGKHPLFRRLMSHLREAHYLSQNPEQKNWLREAKEAKLFSRREFLKVTGCAGVGAAALGIALPKQLASFALASVAAHPVAIIGAGVAGLTTAYRLMKAGVPCEVFEANSRLGGRMFTKDHFNREGMFAELGGEFVDTNHQDLFDLCRELGVAVQPIKAGVAGEDMYFIDDHRYFDDDIIARFAPLAEILMRVRKEIFFYKEGKQLAEYNLSSAKKWDLMSLEEFFHSQCSSVDRVVLKILEVAYIGENGLAISEQSSINLAGYIGIDTSEGFKLFGESDEAHRVAGGSSRLIEALAKAIEGKVKIHTNHALTEVHDRGTQIKLSFVVEDGRRASKGEKFSRVVNTLPFNIFRKVQGVHKLDFAPEKRECIQSYLYGTNGKVIYNLREPLWRRGTLDKNQRSEKTKSNGSVITNLPLNQLWDTGRAQVGHSGVLTNFFGGRRGLGLSVSELSNDVKDIARVFPGAEAAIDHSSTVSAYWAKQPFAQGSYSCLGVGQALTFQAVAGQPALGGRLLFAGEHSSLSSGGFMSGAIQSGNAAADALISELAGKDSAAA